MLLKRGIEISIGSKDIVKQDAQLGYVGCANLIVNFQSFYYKSLYH